MLDCKLTCLARCSHPYMQPCPLNSIYRKSNFTNIMVNETDLKKLKSLTIVHHSRGFCCLSPSHWKHKSIYLPAISFLFYMMKDVYHITDSSWVFFNFCSKKDTCHSINLKYNFRKKGRFGICIKPADKTSICPSLKQV